MSIDEQLAACRRFKARGNLFFKEGQFGLAAEQYRKVGTARARGADGPLIALLQRQVTIYYEYAFPDTDEQQKEIDSIRVHCLTNFSACAMRLGALEDAVDYCEQVRTWPVLPCPLLHALLTCVVQALYSDPGNVKALYRRAQAYRHLDKFAEARRDIEAALAAAPNDSAIQREARSLSNSERAYALRSKGVGKAMFSAKKSASAAGGGGGGGAAEESERAGVDGVAQDAEGHEGAVRDLMETTDVRGFPQLCVAPGCCSHACGPPPGLWLNGQCLRHFRRTAEGRRSCQCSKPITAVPTAGRRCGYQGFRHEGKYTRRR